MKKVVAVVPAKFHSSRVINKNNQLLNGSPLFIYVLEKLIKCDFIDEVYLDSDSDEMFSLCSHLGVKFLKRDPNLASNETDGHSLFMNEVYNIDADIYIQYLCTSPFIDTETIKIGLDKVLNGYDSSILVTDNTEYRWIDGKPEYGDKIPNSCDMRQHNICETTGLYIVPREIALKFGKRYGVNPYFLKASPVESIDINNESDLNHARLVAAGLRNKESNYFNLLKHNLNSSIIHDCLRDYGEDISVISGLSCNLNGIKIMGRARTLHIRGILSGEDPNEIYDALSTYLGMCHNDIIVVNNEVCNRAYFGEINCRLSIKSGVQGAIVKGMTRDINDMSAIGFPVFYEGSTCLDVKNYGVVESHNKPLVIDGVNIFNNDLIFADSDGVVVIPKLIEEKILKLCIEKSVHENKICNNMLEERYSLKSLYGDY